MLQTNLKIFIANLLTYRIFSVVNIVGLSVGFASCLLIALYVLDELSYDRQHRGADNLYRMSYLLAGLNQTDPQPISTSSPQVGPLLQQNFAEVAAFTRMTSEQAYLESEASGGYEGDLLFVDPNFFDFFQLVWLQGDPKTALGQPDSVVLTETLARKYFGSADALGRRLNLRNQIPLRVSGVVRDLRNTYMEGVAVITLGTLERTLDQGAMENWFNARFETFIRLQEGVEFAAVQPALYELLSRQMSPPANSLYDPDSTALTDIYLRTQQSANGSLKIQHVRVLIAVCVALLAIVCVNFINLATARSSERNKEIAVRKVMGAERAQIFAQHMQEASLMVGFSLILALALSELALPLLNRFTHKSIEMFSRPWLLLGISGCGVLIAVVAGAYPSWLSSFRPTAVLKTARGDGVRNFRNYLVIFQFVVAIVLIIGTVVVYRQIQYGKRIALGFEQDRVLVIERELGDHWSSVKARLMAVAGVAAVGATMNPPFREIASSIGARYEGGKSQGENISFMAVDVGYFEALETRLLAGRTFAEERGDKVIQPTDANPHTRASFVINRAMVEKLGWKPETAVGKWFEMNYGRGGGYSESVKGVVVGVVENMHVDSVRREVVPLLYFIPGSVSGLGFALVKVSGENLAATLKSIDAAWQNAYPDQPIKRYFLDTEFQTIYAAEERQALLLSVFAMLAIAISCLGLFGLAAFATERRSKEVGIRKTLGGSVWSIVLLLTNDFSKLVLVSNVVAWPVAYFTMTRWLESFAYRIDMTPAIFVGSGLIALCIAWVTVGGTAAKAASQKPVLALRYE